MTEEARDLIARLRLEPLPREGGFFARTWTSPLALPGGRAAGTAIYFLLTPTDFSALHRLDADELWHFHAGDPIEHVQLHSSAAPPLAAPQIAVTTLGADLANGQTPQLLAPRGAWQGARLAPPRASPPRGWGLVSCTMCPGWTDTGFELGTRDDLIEQFPSYSTLISALTRESLA